MAEQQPTRDFDSDRLFANCEYDKIARMIIPAYEDLYTIALSYFKCNLPETAKLLVVGAGTGMELTQFGQANPDWQMVGVEPSRSMLTIAQQKLEQYKLVDQVTLHHGYVHELPNLLYDGATCILVMQFIPDDGRKLALLKDIAERLKPGAYLILADMFGDKKKIFEQFASIWKQHGQDKGMNPDTMAAILETAKNEIYSVPEPRVLELLQLAGFENTVRFFTVFWYGGWIATKRDNFQG